MLQHYELENLWMHVLIKQAAYNMALLSKIFCEMQ